MGDEADRSTLPRADRDWALIGGVAAVIGLLLLLLKDGTTWHDITGQGLAAAVLIASSTALRKRSPIEPLMRMAERPNLTVTLVATCAVLGSLLAYDTVFDLSVLPQPLDTVVKRLAGPLLLATAVLMWCAVMLDRGPLRRPSLQGTVPARLLGGFSVALVVVVTTYCLASPVEDFIGGSGKDAPVHVWHLEGRPLAIASENVKAFSATAAIWIAAVSLILWVRSGQAAVADAARGINRPPPPR